MAKTRSGPVTGPTLLVAGMNCVRDLRKREELEQMKKAL